MKPSAETTFNQLYQQHLQHLKLKGLQPKTIDAYSRAIRRIGKHFDHQIDNLSEGQLDGVNQDGRSNDKHLGRLDGVSGRGLSGHEITSCG